MARSFHSPVRSETLRARQDATSLPLAALRVMRGAKVHSATSAAASAAACSSRSAAARSRKSSVSTPCAAIRRLRWLMRGWKVGYLVLPEHNGWLPLRVSTVKEK